MSTILGQFRSLHYTYVYAQGEDHISLEKRDSSGRSIKQKTIPIDVFQDALSHLDPPAFCFNVDRSFYSLMGKIALTLQSGFIPSFKAISGFKQPKSNYRFNQENIFSKVSDLSIIGGHILVLGTKTDKVSSQSYAYVPSQKEVRFRANFVPNQTCRFTIPWGADSFFGCTSEGAIRAQMDLKTTSKLVGEKIVGTYLAHGGDQLFAVKHDNSIIVYRFESSSYRKLGCVPGTSCEIYDGNIIVISQNNRAVAFGKLPIQTLTIYMANGDELKKLETYEDCYYGKISDRYYYVQKDNSIKIYDTTTRVEGSPSLGIEVDLDNEDLKSIDLADKSMILRLEPPPLIWGKIRKSVIISLSDPLKRIELPNNRWIRQLESGHHLFIAEKGFSAGFEIRDPTNDWSVVKTIPASSECSSKLAAAASKLMTDTYLITFDGSVYHWTSGASEILRKLPNGATISVLKSGLIAVICNSQISILDPKQDLLPIQVFKGSKMVEINDTEIAILCGNTVTVWSYFAESASKQNIDPTAMIKQLVPRITQLAVDRFDEHDDLFCPITHELFVEPVTDPHGHTFEKSSILEHLERNGPTCPTNRGLLTKDQLVPARALAGYCQKLREKPVVIDLPPPQKDCNPTLAKLIEEEALKKVAEGNYEKVLELYVQVLGFDPSVEVYAKIPAIYLGMNQPAKAALSYLKLASYYANNRQNDEAMEHIKSARNVLPSDHQSIFDDVLLERDTRSIAQQHLDMIDPDLPMHERKHRLIYGAQQIAHLGHKTFEELIGLAIALDESDSVALHARVQCLLNMKFLWANLVFGFPEHNIEVLASAIKSVATLCLSQHDQLGLILHLRELIHQNPVDANYEYVVGLLNAEIHRDFLLSILLMHINKIKSGFGSDPARVRRMIELGIAKLGDCSILLQPLAEVCSPDETVTVLQRLAAAYETEENDQGFIETQEILHSKHSIELPKNRIKTKLIRSLNKAQISKNHKELRRFVNLTEKINPEFTMEEQLLYSSQRNTVELFEKLGSLTKENASARLKVLSLEGSSSLLKQDNERKGKELTELKARIEALEKIVSQFVNPRSPSTATPSFGAIPTPKVTVSGGFGSGSTTQLPSGVAAPAFPVFGSPFTQTSSGAGTTSPSPSSTPTAPAVFGFGAGFDGYHR